MPTYQYVCTECDTPLEAVQRFSDPALTECPACGGTLRKVFSAVGVVFKGSGFYKNDSRASGKPATAAAKGDATASGSSGSSGSSSESSSSGSSASSGSDSKAAPAKKTESKPAASSTSSS